MFSALSDHVSNLARSGPDVCGIRLYMESENASARATYRSRGFKCANYEVMELVFSE